MSRPTLYRWADMPRQSLLDGGLTRTALRGDGSLVTFNWFEPGLPRVEPHSHPFDQVSLVLEGTLLFEIEGEIFEMSPGTALRVPPGARHTAWPKGEERVLNVDIFGPAREDYLFLAQHQAADFDSSDGGSG